MKISRLIACLGILLAGTFVPASAELPSAEAVAARMGAALTPSVTQLAHVRLAAVQPDDSVVRYDANVARRQFGDDLRTIVAFTDAGTQAGTAMLWGARRADGELVEAVYLPKDNRIRRISPVNPEQKFLRTDFIRSDLGLLPGGPATYTLDGRAMIGDRHAWKLEAVPAESDAFSRTVTWVAEDTYLPLRREYYDRAGRLWKVATYGTLVIDGRPTVISLTLDDVQARTSSELVVDSVRYDDASHEAVLFSPDGLDSAADAGVWQALRVRRD